MLKSGLFFILFFMACVVKINAQAYDNKINWLENARISFSDEEYMEVINFQGASHEASHPVLPLFIKTLSCNVQNKEAVLLSLQNSIYEPITKQQLELLNKTNAVKEISEQIIPKFDVAFQKKKSVLICSFVPIRKNVLNGNYERLVSFSIHVKEEIKSPVLNAKKRFSNNAAYSVLSSGNWYKIGITKSAVYKLDFAFFTSLGIDVSTINPKNIRIYGNGGGMLPHANSDFRFDDLQENAIWVYGQEDGVFDKEDLVAFYGKGQVTWTYDQSAKVFKHSVNNFTDTAYYFLNIDLGPGKRINLQAASQENASQIISTFDDYAFHEINRYNLIESGRNWYGEKFDAVDVYDFNFDFPNIDVNSQAIVETALAARSPSNSYFNISSLQNNSNLTLNWIDPECYYCLYATKSTNKLQVNPQGNSIPVKVKYTKTNSSSIGFLDYIRVNARRSLLMSGNQLLFRDARFIDGNNTVEFQLGNANSEIEVWDITSPTQALKQITQLESNVIKFKIKQDTLREFIAFNKNFLNSPYYIQKVENQNLHALPQVDLIIVAHPLFYEKSKELADFHRQEGLRVALVSTVEVYNEFSSGAADVAAIRDFLKMFYERAKSETDLPKYLMLVGDGSYDNKRIDYSNTNFILTYQSENSLSPTESYVSDDFFGLLDQNEGTWNSNYELVDLGIGRLPVKSNEELEVIIGKIKKYYSPAALGEWRNSLVFVADDKDNGIHVNQADQLANYISSEFPAYNVNKIYFDAYPLIASSGGQRYPEVNDAITRNIEKGSLIVNYTGHGGEVGWAHERVLGISEINSLKNEYKLPLFFTATCEFSRFDNPAKTSAGELLLLNSNGGGIGLFTTVRVVYSSPNFLLNDNFFKNVFKLKNGEMPRMGDVFRETKIASGGIINNRNFTFLGDPALKLAYPSLQIQTYEINGIEVQVKKDTLHALQLVNIKGFVQEKSGNKAINFNGILYPTVYDKEVNLKTLSNDPQSPVIEFQEQKNILYKGKVSVKNGEFSFKFIIPKDISYSYGKGKISYYLENGLEDGQGSFKDFYIGGASNQITQDDNGPLIKLFLNDNKFIFGGLTSENPSLYAELMDEHGINTVGNGIGHDLVATLDEKTDASIVLNDYYQADLDNYKSGKITYPFSNLSEGRHTLRLKAWDVYNNSSESYSEFVVAKSAQVALKHVLNYPNPFSSQTQFFFEHNQPGTNLDVQIQIFTVSGKLLKTINSVVFTAGYRSEPISWDGLDDFQDKIARGVYIYKVEVKNREGSKAEKFEKLVILN